LSELRTKAGPVFNIKQFHQWTLESHPYDIPLELQESTNQASSSSGEI